MAQAGPTLPRRTLFAAGAGVVIFPLAAPDQLFLDWEAELARLEALPMPADDDEADQLIDRCGELAELIRATPGRTPAAARAKVRALMGEADIADGRWLQALGDVLRALGG